MIVGSSTDPTDERLTPEDVRAFVRSQRMQERFLHLSRRLDEPPEQSLRLGLELAETARRVREDRG